VCAVRRLVLVAGIVTIAAGIAAAGGLSLEPGPAAPVFPEAARIVCQPEGTVVRTETVLARRDGVHVVVENASRAQLLEIRSDTDAPLGEVPIAAEGTTEATFTIPPGAVTVTCESGRQDGRDRTAAVLAIVDPRDRFVPTTLACGDAELEMREFVAEEIAGEDPNVTAHRTVPGLRPGDRLEKPGYPATQWHGDLLVVVREGENVGRITRAQDRGLWSVVVAACPGTGLTDG
jgi:hypothetical protein